MLLFLIRHALTPITGKKLTGWLPGIDLSADGKRHAQELTERLKDVPFAALYSSPLERCMQTLEPLARSKGLEVITNKGVGEVKYGDWQGRTLTSLYKSKAWAELKAAPGEFRFPNGETVREAQTRGMSAIDELRRKHKGKVVGVCSHADLIRLVVAGYLGVPIDLYDRISIAPASASVLWLDGTPRLLRLSDSGTYSDVIGRLNSKSGPVRKRAAGMKPK
ncbi:MAG TPA: histidine phosphatase family protein [Actinomycetota bacterium]|nr:histidine phosphatase family protein [Actinomycetota bacterium]